MGKRVLVVDDEPDIVDLMVIWLDDDPRCDAVDHAATAGGAVERALATCPDTILLDFRLGGETTAAVLPTLRAACPDARILIHTASRVEADAAGVVGLGADDVLEKATVSLPDVVEAVLG